MKRKTIYTLTLFVFVVMWGIFFATTPANAQPAAQETVVPPEVTLVPPDVNVTAIVPVTGADPAGPNLMTLLFYGFLGLLAIVLLVALFASANRTTVVQRDGHTHSDHDHLP